MGTLQVTATFFELVFRYLTHKKVHGLENIPDTGPAILAVNHLGYLDAPLVYTSLPRKDITSLVAKKYQQRPMMRWLVNLVGGIWVDREQPGPEAIREAMKHLKNGGLLGIAPEGTRSTTKALLRGKSGAAFLAARAKVPIIPGAIWGTESTFSSWKKLKRPEIRLSFGSPFTLDPISRKNRDADLQARADEIMVHIAAILPDSYKGAYLNHPSLADKIAPDFEHRLDVEGH